MKQPLTYGRWILTPNHTSAWDPVCLAASLPRSAYFVAKKELMSIMGPLLHALNGVTITRDTPDITTIKTINRLLSKEKLVVIYPEAKIFTDGVMGPFKSGAFYFLRKRISPVVPVVIKGLERLTPDSFFGRRVSVSFLEPVFPVDTLGMRENAIANMIKSSMETAYDGM